MRVSVTSVGSLPVLSKTRCPETNSQTSHFRDACFCHKCWISTTHSKLLQDKEKAWAPGKYAYKHLLHHASHPHGQGLKPARTKRTPAQSSPEQPRTAQSSPEQPRVAQSSPEQPQAAQSSPEQPRTAQSSPEQPRAAQRAPEQPRAAQSSPEQPRATHSNPEQPRAAQSSPEQPWALGKYAYKHAFHHAFQGLPGQAKSLGFR